jgi:hypothetical protein
MIYFLLIILFILHLHENILSEDGLPFILTKYPEF